MTIFLIVFFLYLLLRYFFRERQKRAGNIYMVGSRFSLLPDHVRMISIVGMAGIALIIVIVSIMGYRLMPEQIAYMLTLGVVIMSVQYLPLLIIGENGLVSIDSQVSWKDVTSARVRNRKIGGSAQIHIGYQSEPNQSTIDIYIHSDQVKDFEKILTELTQVQLENPEA